MTTIVAFTTDTHPNSKVGLAPPSYEIEGVEEPLTVQASRAQRIIYGHWTEFWGYLGSLKRELDAKLLAVFVGDGSDDNKHDTSHLVSTNKADILNVGQAVMGPMQEVADGIIIIRGTPAHTGASAWAEEQLAQRLGAIPDPQAKTFSWWYWRAEIEGVRFHAAHRPPTTGLMPWTRDAAAGRCSLYVRQEYLERDLAPPDVAVFGHYHFLRDSGKTQKPYTVLLPGWCLQDPYIISAGKAGFVRDIGGAWFVCHDGNYEFDHKVWKPRGKKLWKPTWE